MPLNFSALQVPCHVQIYTMEHSPFWGFLSRELNNRLEICCVEVPGSVLHGRMCKPVSDASGFLP